MQSRSGSRFEETSRFLLILRSDDLSDSKTGPEKSLIDFQFEIDPRFPDQNRIPVFILNSIRD
jgi:hypothetical protein